jgi:hypothetical protein
MRLATLGAWLLVTGCEEPAVTDTADDVVRVEVSPEGVTVDVVDGAVSPQTFTAVAVHESGATEPISGTWALDRVDLGAFSADGVFTANGSLGGAGVVSFAADGWTDTADLAVRLVFTAPLDDAVAAALDAATAGDPSVTVVYPDDDLVYPRGLEAPTLQWNGAAPSDVHRVRVRGPFVDYTASVTNAVPGRFQIPRGTWDAIAASSDGPLAVSLQRHDGAVAYTPVTRTWTIAPTELPGLLYYWSGNLGTVQRLAPGDPASEPALTPPAGATCIGCHSVSDDGTRMVASLHGGYAPWATFDAASGEPIYTSDLGSGFQAITPDGAHVLWGQWTNASFDDVDHLVLSASDDPTELARLTAPSGAPAHPAWSPDASRVAFSVRTDGNGLDFTSSSLWVADVSWDPPSFGGLTAIAQGDVDRPTLTFPTFAPDSTWIAFERATQSRARGAESDLWLTNADGSVQVELAAANGGAQASYEPEFLPIEAGGYYWIAFASQRPYGNTLTDTDPGSRRNQIWIAAVDRAPVPSDDPSHAAFWLPGQDLADSVLRAQWTAAAP